jgi:hypothetical protein
MLNLVGAGKRILVYYAPTKDFHVLANQQELQALLARCDKDDIDNATRALRLKAPLDQARMPLTLH